MNRNKLLRILPYIGCVLILVFVLVILISQISSSIGEDVEDGEKTQQTAGIGTEQTQTQTPAPTKPTNPDPTTPPSKPTSIPTATPTPKPTSSPKPTASPTPTPITDLTYGLKFEPKSDFVFTKHGINIRLGASTDSPIVAFLEWGKAVERTGYNAEWTRIIYDGQECYIATRLVARIGNSLEEVSKPTSTPTPKTTATPTPVPEDDGDDFNYWEDEDDEGSETEGFATDIVDGITFSPEVEPNGRVVCIDPGHQLKANNGTEPLGSGSGTTKKKVSAGTTGVSTKVPEYQLDLDVSLKLRDELLARGYIVVMTRVTNDVDISNLQRAMIANFSGADVFIRIHANGSDDSSVEGVETFCMRDDSPFNVDLFDWSYELSELILANIVDQTGAKSRGVKTSNDYVGINWSQVPVTIVEMGYMSNAKEDKLLNSDDYQNKIVQGIADGLDQYYEY